MGQTTIEWTATIRSDGTVVPGYTFNPWWGCAHVSPGCDNCYAETWAKRHGTGWGHEATRRLFGEAHWQEPLKWNKKAEKEGVRRRVFCASMADVFESNSQITEERQKLWRLIMATPYLDWLLLTKRPHNMTQMVPESWEGAWPRNVWAGTTVENQVSARKRIPALLNVPAVVRFLSCEPLLGPVNLDPAWLPRISREEWQRKIDAAEWCDGEEGGECWCGIHDPWIHWVICGGESGHGARPMHPDWARSLRDQCTKAGVAYHFKQWGEWKPASMSNDIHVGLIGHSGNLRGKPFGSLTNELDETFDNSAWVQRVGKKASGRLLDGRTWDEFPRPGV